MPVTVKRSRCGKLIVMWHTYLAGSKAFVLNRDMDAGTVEAQVRANPSFASHVTREREALSRRTCASEHGARATAFAWDRTSKVKWRRRRERRAMMRWRRWHPPRHRHASLLRWKAMTRCRAWRQRAGCTTCRIFAASACTSLSCAPTASGRMRATPRHVATATASFAIDLQLSARSGKARNARPQVTATPTAATSSGGCCRGAPSGRATGPS